jgi:hypothetical protein
VEAAPGRVPAQGRAHDVELVTKLQRVGELLDVRGVALQPTRLVGVAVAVPGSVEVEEVDPQLLGKLLHRQHTSSTTSIGVRFCLDKYHKTCAFPSYGRDEHFLLPNQKY